MGLLYIPRNKIEKTSFFLVYFQKIKLACIKRVGQNIFQEMDHSNKKRRKFFLFSPIKKCIVCQLSQRETYFLKDNSKFNATAFSREISQVIQFTMTAVVHTVGKSRSMNRAKQGYEEKSLQAQIPPQEKASCKIPPEENSSQQNASTLKNLPAKHLQAQCHPAKYLQFRKSLCTNLIFK